MDEEVKPSSSSNINNEQVLSLWKRMEKLEEKMERALENLDSKVQALEMAHQLQTYQNSMTKEKLDELARGQVELLSSLKKDRLEDRDTQKKERAEEKEEQKKMMATFVESIHDKEKAAIFDKIKWVLITAFLLAMFGILAAAIINPT